MTNREMLSKMNNEELARFLTTKCCPYCIFDDTSSEDGCLERNCTLGTELWLGREVKEDHANE